MHLSFWSQLGLCGQAHDTPPLSIQVPTAHSHSILLQFTGCRPSCSKSCCHPRSLCIVYVVPIVEPERWHGIAVCSTVLKTIMLSFPYDYKFTASTLIHLQCCCDVSNVMKSCRLMSSCSFKSTASSDEQGKCQMFMDGASKDWLRLVKGERQSASRQRVQTKPAACSRHCGNTACSLCTQLQLMKQLHQPDLSQSSSEASPTCVMTSPACMARFFCWKASWAAFLAVRQPL